MNRTIRLNASLVILAVFILPSVVLSGCETITGKAQNNKRRALLEEKIDKYKALEKTIASQELKNGMRSAKIRETFGDPDDIFASGSTTGRFEIWSYEEFASNGKPTWHSIRLYFSNDKLVSWNY